MSKSEINKAYYEKNRENLLIKSRNYQAKAYANEDKRAMIIQRQKAYYQNNRDIILQKAKDKRAPPPESEEESSLSEE